jgi:PEGA domain-containing protein
MARALLVPMAICLLAATGAVAHAKPKVAVLGLEAIHGQAAIDQQTTVVAHDITEALRARARSGTGTLTLAPGSERELLDEKITHACDDEALDCMTQIGKGLNAEFLIYGNIEKIDPPDPTKKGYRVNIKILNIAKKGVSVTIPDFIPIGNSNEDNLKTWSKRAYSKLTGQDTTGTLIVRANVDRGTVLIDGVPKTTLSSGMATIPLEEGRYGKVSIEAEGYETWTDEQAITIRAGDTVNRQAELEKKKKPDVIIDTGGTVSHSNSHTVVKILAGVGIAAFLGGGGMLIYDWKVNLTAYADGGVRVIDSKDTTKTIQGDALGSRCGEADPSSDPKALENFKKSCDARGRTFIEWPVMVGGAVLAGVAIGYLAFGTSDKEHNASRGTPRKNIAITPIIAPQASGAVLTINW